MTVSEKFRSAMYHAFLPLLGEEATADMLSCFPATDGDAPASREFVHAEIAGVRAEIAGVRTEIADVRTEMAQQGAGLRGEMADLASELRGEMADLRTELVGEMAELRSELRGEMADLRIGVEAAMRQQTNRMMGTVIGAAGIVIAAVGVLG